MADEPIFREGLLRLLDRYPTVRVVGWSSDVATAALLASTHHPDVLLACLQSMTQVHDLARELPGVPVLALVPAPTADVIAAANAAGVQGVLDRTGEIDDIVEALRVVRRGFVVHPPVGCAGAPAARSAVVVPVHRDDEPPSAPAEGRSLVALHLDGSAPRPANGLAPDLGLLTPRERQILQLLVDGYSVKQVASRLGIAMQTGKNHIHNIMGKVGASTRLQLCAWANDHGVHPSRPLLPGSVSEDDGF